MKILTYFLPQFYPTPENDKYWGKGFTDWVNVKSSIPLFNGHKQPLSPAKFGMYNLSDKETIKKLSKYKIVNVVRRTCKNKNLMPYLNSFM